MKRTVRTLAAFLAMLPVLASCTNKEGGEGRVEFLMSSQEAIEEATKSQVSDYTALPATSDFTISVTDQKGKSIYQGPVKDYPVDKELTVGNYNVDAIYGSVTEEGFDKPCFKGSQSFTVKSEELTTVSIGVKLANSLVKVVCTDLFKSYFTDYSFTVKTGNGTSIPFPKGETRAAFVDAYTISIEGTMTSQAGKTQSFSKSYTTALAPATCYAIKFDAGNIGSNTITISFNNNVESVDLGWIELN